MQVDSHVDISEIIATCTRGLHSIAGAPDPEQVGTNLLREVTSLETLPEVPSVGSLRKHQAISRTKPLKREILGVVSFGSYGVA